MPAYIHSFIVSIALVVLAFSASHIGDVHVAVVTLFFALVMVGLGLYQLQREDSR